MTRSSVAVLALGVLAVSAAAQGAPDPLEACKQVTDPTARLACFDHEMQRRDSATVTGARPPAAAATQPTVPAPATVDAPRAAPAIARAAGPAPSDDTVGLDGKQLIIKRKQEGIDPPRPAPIVAVLVKLRERPGHQYHFELGNGQVWESTDSQPALFVSPRETVTIRPGVLGAFFLKTQEGNSIRVHRLE